MRGKILIVVALLAAGHGLARVCTRRAGPSLTSRLRMAFGTVGFFSAVPATISFSATNPDLGVVAGSSPASLSWQIVGGSHATSWTVSLQAPSSNFSGCPTIPVSAVQVSCGSASAGGNGTASCSGSFPLSTAAQQIAGGAEGDGTNSYSVSINFTLAESWRYVANPSCSLTVNYSVNAQ